MALPLDIAEQVLIAAIRTNISVRSLNADALSILNVLGPRQEFPTIPDSALHHMIWISLDSIAQAGDTWLLGRLLDPTVAKPSPPIRTLRSSPHVLARASEAGHLDFLGYWLRLVRRFDVVPLTLTMVRRAISAAVRAEQLHVLEWWVNAIPKLFLQYELEQCWAAAYEAAESILVLDHIKKLRMADYDGNVNRSLVQRMLDDNVRDDYWSFESAIIRAHGAGNLAVMHWWFSQLPHLDKVRFLLPRMLTWDKRYVASNLYFFWANDLSQRTGPCLTLCWRQYERSRLIFADLDAWKANAPDLLKRALDQALCRRCRDIIQNSSPSTCPVRECAQDHRIDCTIPPEGLFRDRKFHKQHLSMALCKEGLVAGFRALLHSGRNAFAYVHSHAFLVASKRGHFGILRVWLEECQDVDFRAYPLWDGVGISVLDWLLEHDVDRKWLRWMSLDEASRAGQTHVLDWWLDRLKQRQVPTLRFSYRALQFKSYESGVKSLRWWLRSGLLFEDELPVVSVWRYCYLEQFDLVEMLVAGGVSVCFQPLFPPRPPPWPERPKQNQAVIADIRRWWDRARMANKLGGITHGKDFGECLHHVESMDASCKWSREMKRAEL